MTGDHPAVIIDDGAQNGLMRPLVDQHPGAMHEIADPQIIDMAGFISFSNIVSFAHQQVLFFYDSQKGVVMDRRLPQQKHSRRWIGWHS